MRTEDKINFEKLISQEKSGWIEKAQWREDNQAWLDKSALIAMKILKAIRDQETSQTKLADKMEVTAQYINKIVKGNENLSLETISKLEMALGIQLIEVVGFSSFVHYEIPEPVLPITTASTPIDKVLLLENETYGGQTESYEKAA